MGMKEELRSQTGEGGSPETSSRGKAALPLALKGHRPRSRAIWWHWDHGRRLPGRSHEGDTAIAENIWLLPVSCSSNPCHSFSWSGPGQKQTVEGDGMGLAEEKGGCTWERMHPFLSSKASAGLPSHLPTNLSPSHFTLYRASVLCWKDFPRPMSDSKVIVRLNLPTCLSAQYQGCSITLPKTLANPLWWTHFRMRPCIILFP